MSKPTWVVCTALVALVVAVTTLVLFCLTTKNETKRVHLLYFLAALGPPNLPLKRNILQKNLTMLRAQPDVATLDVVLNTYGQMDQLSWLEADVRAAAPGCRIYRYHKDKAVLVQLWQKDNPHMATLRAASNRYDHVVFVLDDVRIDKLDAAHFARTYRQMDLDIMSPVVHGSTHSFGVFDFNEQTDHQNKAGPMVQPTNVCEFFLYFCSHKAFFRLIDRYDCENPWMWGYDLLLGFWKFRTAVVSSGQVTHLLQDSSRHNNRKSQCMTKFLLKNGFSSTNSLIKLFPAKISPPFSLSNNNPYERTH